jgi:F-type H+-transporting ATPase subunit gamma
MTETTESLGRSIRNAGDLQGVVRTMKALAASSIGQYERSVRALTDYYRAVQLGLGPCLRDVESVGPAADETGPARKTAIGGIVFGSDQGLVGQFNDVVADFALESLASAPPGKRHVWAVGERVHARLRDAGLAPHGLFTVPSSVQGITSLVGQIQIATESRRSRADMGSLWDFHNRPQSGAIYEAVGQRLLPLDAQWRKGLAQVPWPTACLPQVMGSGLATLRALIGEYQFISLFRACAESLASENATRLAAMERADKNISELLEQLHRKFRRVRQDIIDEELFDVIAGFEAENNWLLDI